MSAKRISVNATTLYIIAIVIIIVAFLLLGGGSWMSGMIHRSRSISMVNLNWAQILIGLGVGFLLGYVVSRRKG
jgi:hypothetical protein